MPPREKFQTVEERDLLVLAGDIGVQMMARKFIEQQLEVSPVIYIPGNHEYYSNNPRDEVDARWKTFSEARPDFHYLIAETATLCNAVFFGAPWYSNLWGCPESSNLSLIEAQITDFECQNDSTDPWTVSKHVATHERQTKKLQEIARNAVIDVVVTHWPPTKGAIRPNLSDEGDLNCYYFNDQEDLVKSISAKLWVSGHTHTAYDYMCGETRCVGNPGGYPSDNHKEPEFHTSRVVEIQT